MTKTDMMNYKRFAKEACNDRGIKTTIKNMSLLETSAHMEEFLGEYIRVIDYVMFEDRKSGKQFQCTYGVNNYTSDNESLYFVREYAF